MTGTPKLQPGVGFHLQDDGTWEPEKIPSDVLKEAVFSGYLTIEGYRSTVFETKSKDQWAQKSTGTSALAARVAALTESDGKIIFRIITDEPVGVAIGFQPSDEALEACNAELDDGWTLTEDDGSNGVPYLVSPDTTDIVIKNLPEDQGVAQGLIPLGPDMMIWRSEAEMIADLSDDDGFGQQASVLASCNSLKQMTPLSTRIAARFIAGPSVPIVPPSLVERVAAKYLEAKKNQDLTSQVEEIFQDEREDTEYDAAIASYCDSSFAALEILNGKVQECLEEFAKVAETLGECDHEKVQSTFAGKMREALMGAAEAVKAAGDGAIIEIVKDLKKLKDDATRRSR